jgi:hypothetical protein
MGDKASPDRVAATSSLESASSVPGSLSARAHIRVLVQQSLSGLGFRLRELASRDLDDPGLVEIGAVVLARLGIEPHVTAVSWELVEHEAAT